MFSCALSSGQFSPVHSVKTFALLQNDQLINCFLLTFTIFHLLLLLSKDVESILLLLSAYSETAGLSGWFYLLATECFPPQASLSSFRPWQQFQSWGDCPSPPSTSSYQMEGQTQMTFMLLLHLKSLHLDFKSWGSPSLWIHHDGVRFIDHARDEGFAMASSAQLRHLDDVSARVGPVQVSCHPVHSDATGHLQIGNLARKNGRDEK